MHASVFVNPLQATQGEAFPDMAHGSSSPGVLI